MTETKKHIGTLEGKVLAFGGTYSNYQSLTRLHEIADSHGIAAKNIIHTGDLIGYCASPSQCTGHVEDWGIHCIQGNVEENILSGSDDCGCNYAEGGRCEMFSRSWFPFAKEQVTEKNRRFLESMPHQLTFEYAGKAIAVIHGSSTYISEFIFKSNPWSAKAPSFKETGADVILSGHCGIPFADEKNGKIWLNAGVIGMPANDGTPYVWYLLLDDSHGEFTYDFHCFEYDNFEANQLMMERGLPWSYAETLMTGIWDNTEILPQQEIAEQGKKNPYLAYEQVRLLHENHA